MVMDGIDGERLLEGLELVVSIDDVTTWGQVQSIGCS